MRSRNMNVAVKTLILVWHYCNVSLVDAVILRPKNLRTYRRITNLAIFRCPVNKQGNSSHSLGVFGYKWFVTILRTMWRWPANPR